MAESGTVRPEDVLAFWFEESSQDDWFAKSEAFDRTIRERFGATYEDAVAGRLEHWRETPEGALALVLVLDQFPRNMFRGDARAYAADAQARAVVNAAIDAGFDLRLPRERRIFLYLPLEHSEDLADQRRCLALIKERIGEEVYIDYAERHLAIIERFGRFPHRNAVLGRPSTPEELAFLDEPGSSF